MFRCGELRRVAVERHRGEHLSFMQEVERLRGAITDETTESAESLLNFLIHWLVYHILGSDQRMARRVGASRSGGGYPDEHRPEVQKGDGVVKPLLNALDELFRQVSDRNRELMLLNQTLEVRVAERTRELGAANERLQEIALTDALTGLPNRRHAMLRLAEVWKESLETSVPLACIMIDADGFKQVNDTHGHEAGDEVLRRLSRELRYSVRTDDFVCRLGGDEFLVICPYTPLEGVRLLAEKLVHEVASLCVYAGDEVMWRGSISVGASVRVDAMRNPEALISSADKGVYLAKKYGRGRAAFAPLE